MLAKKRKAKKWGNSLAVRLPKDIVEKLEIQENTELELIVEENKVIIKKNKEKTLSEMLDSITADNTPELVSYGKAED